MPRKSTKPSTSKSSIVLLEGSDSIQDRLSRIEGHVRGIKKMVSEERSYEEILTQIAGVKAAANQVALKVLEMHLESFAKDSAKPVKREQALIDYKRSLSLLLR